MVYVQHQTRVYVQMDGMDQDVNIYHANRLVNMAGNVLRKIRVIAAILTVILVSIVKSFNVTNVCTMALVLLPIRVTAPTLP
jgi:hypothetical protein